MAAGAPGWRAHEPGVTAAQPASEEQVEVNARAVGRAAFHVQGQVAHDRGRRHQPAASALDVFGQLRTLTEQAGREPAESGSRSGSRWVLERKRIEGDPVLERSRLFARD